jgi:putative transposase
MGIVTRTEQIQFKSKEISVLAHASKNLYNSANFEMRKRFFENEKLYHEKKEKGKPLFYSKTKKNSEQGLYEMFKDTELYKELPAQTAQWTLKKLSTNWKSYFANHTRWLKEFKENPSKFPIKVKEMPDGTIKMRRKFGGLPVREEEPCIPNYKPKDGEYILVFTNQQCWIENGMVRFPPKSMISNLKIKTRLIDVDLREVRIIPNGFNYVCEIVYNKEINPEALSSGRMIGIDLGASNLVTIGNNFGAKPIVVKGGVAKGMNHYYNREKTRLQSIYDKVGIKYGNKLSHLNWKRNNKFRDYFHKISRFIINYVIENNIDIIVIGKNDLWKKKSNIGKRNNQNFTSIPHTKLIEMIQYKAQEVGIEVILQEEAHTSKCSFLDNESLEHHEKYMGKRIKRGLFRSVKGILINADVNGALNIMRKAFPNAFANGIQGVGLHPVRCYI